MTLPQHIDSTMMTCFRSCPRKFHNEFILGLRPPGISIDLHAGACFASALEQVYRGLWEQHLSLEFALIKAQAKFFVEWGDVEPPEWKKTAKTADRVWEAVESYFTTYTPLTDHVRPYLNSEGKPSLEYTFAIPLDDENFPEHPDGEPFIYCGRFDMLGQYQDNPCVRDEKTTGYSIGRNWASQWDLRSQFMGYVWACQQAGLPLNTVVVRGIAIQMTQIVHAEAIKIYAAPLVEKWYEQLRRDMWRLRRAWDEQYFDYNLGDSCTAYGQCQFLNACASQNPENWFTEFEVKHWDPTRKNPVAGVEEFDLTA
jgi:PD-(D/E)XK nuclease superfamily